MLIGPSLYDEFYASIYKKSWGKNQHVTNSDVL